MGLHTIKLSENLVFSVFTGCVDNWPRAIFTALFLYFYKDEDTCVFVGDIINWFNAWGIFGYQKFVIWPIMWIVIANLYVYPYFAHTPQCWIRHCHGYIYLTCDVSLMRTMYIGGEKHDAIKACSYGKEGLKYDSERSLQSKKLMTHPSGTLVTPFNA